MKLIAAPPLLIQHAWPVASFLGGIPDSLAAECFRAGRFARFSEKEALIRQHDTSNTVFLLVSGIVKATCALRDKGKAVLGIRVPGDIVGELAATDGLSRSANVEVWGRTPVIACMIDGPAFTQLLSRHPEGWAALTTSVSTRLRTATRRQVDYLDFPALVRIARILVELAEDHAPAAGTRGGELPTSLKQIEIGSLVGVRKAQTERVLRKLRAEDVISADRPPRILDATRLREVAML
jgi:CRP/FNR family transcriptional regulator, cyclic AMP receptor protein